MTLFPMDLGQARTRLVEAGAVFAAVALVAGCGSSYRPVVTPISPSGPPAQPSSLAVVVSSTSPTQPGTATIIDYAGDDIMAQQPIGIGPKALTVDEYGSTAYTVNSDGTLTTFPVSTSFQSKNVEDITLFPTTKLTGLYSPTTGVWASDLDKNVVDYLASGSPDTFSMSIPVAPTPIAAIGPGVSGQYTFVISLNSSTTPANKIIPYDTTCNITSNFSTLTTGEADTVQTSSRTVTTKIPLGVCPVYGVISSDKNRVYVLNRGDDTVTVINAQTGALDSCKCPATGCVNQNDQAYFCHPTLPLSIKALKATGITPPHCTTANCGMLQTAGPVYAEFNATTSQLIISDYDGGTISVIDVSLDEFGNDSPNFGTTFTIPVGNYPASVTVLPDGSRAYTANQADQSVTIVNLSSHTVEKTLPVNGYPRTVVSTANSLYGKVYVASPNSSLLSIIRTDLDIADTTILVPGDIVDVRVSTQTGTSGNSNNTSRIPGAGQPCYLPPTVDASPTMQECQTLPAQP
jgi:YVTN family beta-propeller protein